MLIIDFNHISALQDITLSCSPCEYFRSDEIPMFPYTQPLPTRRPLTTRARSTTTSTIVATNASLLVCSDNLYAF